MRTTSSPAATAGRTLARVLKAGLSLLVLVVAVVGLPLLLAWATPVIWAATHDDAMHLLDRQGTGSVFLLLLACVGWIGWAQFTFCAVRELIAQLRGRTWHAPRGMGASQRAAALLIGSIIVLLPTGSALASDAQAAPATTAARVPGQAQAPQAAKSEQSTALAASTAASGTTYTVRQTRPAESLWGIAERELGDGERWREIAHLNEGHTMADGTIFRANSFLQPGWQLRMPETAAAAGGVRTQLGDSEPAAEDKGGHVVTVHPGDYLSKIAEKELGDGDDWPRLFDASRGKPQPHGLPKITDPDIIYAGQQVTVPEARPDHLAQGREEGGESGEQKTTPPATPNPGSKQKPGDGTSNAPTPAPRQTTAPAPESSAPSAPPTRPAEQPGEDQASPSAPASAKPEPSASPSATSPSASKTSGPAASSPATPAPTIPATTPASSSPLNLRIVLGAGALLAAAITGALAVRRLLQRRRRKPGERIAIAPQTSPAEAKLAAAAEPAGAARLHLALHTLAHLADQDGQEVPVLRAARIGARSLQILSEDLVQEPRAPFTTGQTGWWQLAADAALLDQDETREMPAPYPGLVTIGSTASGELLLLNLTHTPAVLLDGDPLHITEVCTSLALELGMSPWASEVEVVTVGFGEDLPQLLPTCRIAHMRQPAHALRDLTERLLEAHQMPDTCHQPYLLLCTATLDADTAWQFADLIDKAGDVPVTLIAPAHSAAAHFPEAETLNASLSTPQPLDSIGTDIIVQRLEHAAYEQITTALALSGQPAEPAHGPWQDVPDEPDPGKQSELAMTEQADGLSTADAPDSSSEAGATVPVTGNVADSDVFPALLAASADPSGLRLLPAAPHHGQNAPGEDLAADRPETKEPEVPTSAVPEPESAGGTAPGEAHNLHAPEIRVLGPVEVDNVASTGHGPRIAQLAALTYFRPGRTADALCSDMDPLNPWSPTTLNARLQGLRRALGNDPAGNPYVPRRRTGDDPYRLAPAVRCDWTRFLQLAERALPQGPAGLPDLEKALGLVRGRPFGSRPLPWAEPFQQEMITRIIDVAHTVATYRTPVGTHHDLSAARQAIATGLDTDDSAELLYRDWMRVEHTAGNRSGLHTAIARIQQVNRSLDASLELETEQLINELLHGHGPATRKAP
ncbi:LysM peptidoglycan-binding domain-containing protein [Streptomyces puniciscabiei]